MLAYSSWGGILLNLEASQSRFHVNNGPKPVIIYQGQLGHKCLLTCLRGTVDQKLGAGAVSLMNPPTIWVCPNLQFQQLNWSQFLSFCADAGLQCTVGLLTAKGENAKCFCGVYAIIRNDIQPELRAIKLCSNMAEVQDKSHSSFCTTICEIIQNSIILGGNTDPITCQTQFCLLSTLCVTSMALIFLYNIFRFESLAECLMQNILFPY